MKTIFESILNGATANYAGFPDDELQKMYDLAFPVRYLSYEEKKLSLIAFRDFSEIQKEIRARKEQLNVAS